MSALAAPAPLPKPSSPSGRTRSRPLRVLQVGMGEAQRAAHRSAIGLVAFPHERICSASALPLLGTVDDLDVVLHEQAPSLAVVTPPAHAHWHEVRRALRRCTDAGIRTVCLSPGVAAADPLSLAPPPTAPRAGAAARIVRRGVDICGALVGIALTAPVLLGAAVAVKATSRGPVLFRQQRVGEGGRVFGCLKFRTMRVGAEREHEALRSLSIQDGPAFKIPDDPRVTSIGRFLRRYSLDELPQLFNVLFGSMSLVGPRPPMPSEVARYTWWQRHRVQVKPGLTCLWQVAGRNRVPFQRWVEMDLFYIHNRSLWLDAKLLWQTVPAVLRGTGM